LSEKEAMFFFFSKLIWFFLAPSHLAIWLTVIGAILLAVERKRIALWFVSAGAILLVGLAYYPVGVWMMQPQENRYSLPPKWPAHVDGILVLGGGLNSDILQSRGAIGVPDAEPRLVSAFELARRYPKARVVFSGGSPVTVGGPETVPAKHIFNQMGLAPDRLVLENQSRDTWENFVFSKRLVKPKPGEVWVVCTSAFHMPRAMAIAARVGWKMIPWPTDYTTAGHNHYIPREFPQNLQRADLAAHEWVGLLAYEWSGRSAPAQR
jgi:uncharacterized SAM-binding protein YcdF (DUF218 family)